MGRNCVFKNFVHLIFVTKYRRNVLTGPMLDRLHDIFLETCYCVVSCGGAPLEVVKKYVEDQRRPLENRQIKLSENFTGRKRSKTKEWLA
jgi:REP element-mobilizing transposase RayT